MSSNYENLDKVEDRVKEMDREAAEKKKKEEEEKKKIKKVDDKKGDKKADKKGDKKKATGEEKDKNAMEPFQVLFKLDTVTHYMIGLAIFWVTAMSATACSFFLPELLYPPSLDGTINCIMHGVLVILMHLTGLALFLGKDSNKTKHWKYKFYIIFLISFLCTILTPLVSNSLKVFSVTLTVHCVIGGLSAFYIAFIMAHAIWKPGPPSFFANLKRTVLVEKRPGDKKTKKSKSKGSTGTKTGGTTKSAISTPGTTGTTGGTSKLETLDGTGGKSKIETAKTKKSAVTPKSKSKASKT